MTPKELVEGNWWFMKLGAGTTGARGLRDVLQGARLKGPELFVREVTQNSVDAFDADRATEIRLVFRAESLTPGRARRLKNFLFSDGTVSAHSKAFRGLDRFPERPEAFDRLGEEGADVRALFVEDYGTVGLGGEIGGTSALDHFTRLVYLFGETHDEGTKGGAFGFGKSVLSTASSIRTVLYYSRPRSVDGVSQPSRLIAVSLFPSHQLGGIKFTGYALCGLHANDEAYPIYPIEGESADDLAEALGFQRRDSTDIGTSIMILGCDYAMESIRLAVEKWWWPRIVLGGHGRLSVEFADGETEYSAPDPKHRKELRAFVRAYERLLDGRKDEEGARIAAVRTIGKQEVGKLSLLALEERPDEEGENWYVDKVATFRGPGLVVEYMDVGRSHLEPFVGVFQAHPDVDPILRRSEPPAHDRWASESDRLDGQAREDTIVASVERRTKALVSEFQKALEPEPKESARRFRSLETLLGRVFRRGTAPGPVPEGAQRPIHLHVTEARDHRKGIDTARIKVEHREGFDAVDARLEVEAHVLGDANKRQLERVEVQVRDERGVFLAEGTHAEYPFKLLEGESITFEASANSDIESMVRFRVRVVGI